MRVCRKQIPSFGCDTIVQSSKPSPATEAGQREMEIPMGDAHHLLPKYREGDAASGRESRR